MAASEITEDALLNGRIRIRQPKRGYRVNVDTLLLAATLPGARIRSGGTRVAEPCCGVGAALLAVATGRQGDVSFVGIERDPAYAELARQNVALNAQSQRVTIVEADALDPNAEFGVFDYVLLNPPYDNPEEGRPPAEGKHAAFIADRPFEDWIKVWSNRMGPNSNMTLIHRAHRLGEILAAFEGRLGGIEVFPIRPAANAKARRVIVRAWKGSRAPLKLFAGLDLHPSDDAKEKYTPEAEAILRGDAHINFG
ncbi:tRNA1(Val) (adenine(37)-N6)-methyltransferase [Terricaulis silvestris]|uniref:Putative methyltransferase n=1 Tax=Terricaulis silvestris TaxID=2686094 RepID=A0A6I6MKM1_9CAUL|nr:N-6 DNA methylase [Terricaulis silvestris]QGZ95800.1 putative methyltransferase [Terricaulis silvestris]